MSELIQKLKGKGIGLPLSLKKVGINTLCQNNLLGQIIFQTMKLKFNNQDGVGGETIPAPSSQMTDNEAWRMMSSRHELNELNASIRGIRDSVTKLSNEFDVLRKN